ncbi:MAG: hypothetical protein R3C09_20295 [Pirellulaceae bacterium]|jgi:hypothetical protein
MANRPINFRELLDVEVTVWRSREGGDSQLDVCFAKRSKASRGVQKFGMSDMATIKLQLSPSLTPLNSDILSPLLNPSRQQVATIKL